MIKRRLPKHWQKYLLSFPETGMGWQRVTIRCTNSTELVGVVVVQGEYVLLDSAVPWDMDQIASIEVLK